MKSKLNIIIVIFIAVAFYAYKKLEKSYKRSVSKPTESIVKIANENETLTQESLKLFKPDVYYFLPIDRFVDGDTLNNSNIDQENPLAFHGGDIKGMIKSFDEIKSLGITKIILTSVQKQIESTFEITDSAGKKHQVSGFEGSSIEDYRKFDKRFGDMNDLKNFVDLAHQNKIKVLLSFNGKSVSKRSTLQNNSEIKNYILANKNAEECTFNNTKVRNTSCVPSDEVNLNHEDPNVVESTLTFLLKLKDKTSIDGIFIENAQRYEEDYLNTLKEKVSTNFEIIYDYKRELINLISSDIELGVATHFTSYFGLYTLSGYFSNADGFYNVKNLVKNFNIISNLRASNLIMMFSFLRGRSPYYQYGESVNNLKIGLVLGALQNTSMMIVMGDEIVREDTGFPFLLSNMRFHDKTIKPNSSLSPDTEIRKFYQKLLQAKLNYPILSNGIFNELYSNNELLVIEKTIEGSSKKALIIINKYFNPQNVSFNLPQSYKGLTSNEVLSGENLTASEDSQIQLNIKEESIQVHIFN